MQFHCLGTQHFDPTKQPQRPGGRGPKEPNIMGGAAEFSGATNFGGLRRTEWTEQHPLQRLDFLDCLKVWFSVL
jgi:hypothetical protein